MSVSAGMLNFGLGPDIDTMRDTVRAFAQAELAPRAAAMEPRFAACLAWGGHWDYHESWVRRRKIMGGR